jgi:hypothetical protein
MSIVDKVGPDVINTPSGRRVVASFECEYYKHFLVAGQG